MTPHLTRTVIKINCTQKKKIGNLCCAIPRMQRGLRVRERGHPINRRGSTRYELFGKKKRVRARKQ